MYDKLIEVLRYCETEKAPCKNCPYAPKDEEDSRCGYLLIDAADAIEAQDRRILTLQHEMMAEAESHATLVERLNKQIEELANVRPVVRGKWRPYSPLTDTYECDKCGYQVIDESFRTNFCPNCGADMREES